MYVRRNNSFSLLLAITPAALLVAPRAVHFCAQTIMADHCFFSLDRNIFFLRHGTLLTCQDVSNQFVHHPDRATVAFLIPQAHELCLAFIRPWWCIQLHREDRQAVAM